MFLVAILATPTNKIGDTVNPVLVCEAAADVFKDMRYIGGGKIAERGDYTNKWVAARLQRCQMIAGFALPYGPDLVYAAVAVGFNESNFRADVVGKRGEQGMMQVVPRYHCLPYRQFNDGKGGCLQPEKAGVASLNRIFVANKGDLLKTLRQYNGGQPYAEKVGRFVRYISRSYQRKIALQAQAVVTEPSSESSL